MRLFLLNDVASVGCATEESLYNLGSRLPSVWAELFQSPWSWVMEISEMKEFFQKVTVHEITCVSTSTEQEKKKKCCPIKLEIGASELLMTGRCCFKVESMCLSEFCSGSWWVSGRCLVP